MRTIQEKYNAVLSENFDKGQFVRDARLELPNLVTQFNGFEDTVTILKNKGILQEAKKDTTPEYDKPSAGYSIGTLERGVDYELEKMGVSTIDTVPEDAYIKAKEKAEKNLAKDPLHYLNLLSGESKKVNKHDKMVKVEKNNHVDTFNGMKKAELKESVIKKVIEKGYTKEQVEIAIKRLQEKKLTTSEKEKKEDIVKGLKKSGFKKDDPSTYAIATAKAKELAEGRRSKMKGGKVVTENDYETGGYVEAMGPRLEKAIKHLIQTWEEWKQGPMTQPGMIPHAKTDLLNYLTQTIKEEQEEINEQHFDDLEAAKEYARKESKQGFVQHVNRLPKGGFKVEDWLDGSDTVASYQGGLTLEDHTDNPEDKYIIRYSKENNTYQVWEGEHLVTDFATKERAEEYAKRENNKQGLNEAKLKNAFKHIITNILKEEVITEAATGNLSKLANDYDDFEGMQEIVNSLENIVTDIESYYGKTREKIQDIFNKFVNVKNPDGLNVGPFLAPAVQAAFMKDLTPVRDKGFTKGLTLPKVKIIKPGDIQDTDLEEKKTVYTPISEGIKTKYTKRRK